MQSVDFLPICDLLFNFVSLASYFCDVTFDLIVVHSFFRDGHTFWFLVTVCAIILSLFVSQILSIKWYIEDEEQEQRSLTAKVLVYLIHLVQGGVLWRYGKLLFLPMGSAIPLVKREMRNLCILRMIHAFCQGLPLLFAQAYLMATQNPHLTQIHTVSMILSLFGIGWALASFNKNVRPKDIDKLVLTWIGVIFQLLWRIGTVTSRVAALVIYASAFHFWVILVLVLHWLCMFLWLLFQQFDSESIGKSRISKVLWSFILSYVHNIAYINVDKETDTKVKVAIFYVVTLVENILLVSLWMTSYGASLEFEPEQRRDVLMIVILSFLGGLFFMVLYYRLFHHSKISSSLQPSDEETVQPRTKNQEKMDMTEYSNNQAVFNCVLNPAMRKKKKIPSVLPPPPPGGVAPVNSNAGGKSATPFWKEPLPLKQDSIRQKLQSKRENQLRQLQLLENEMRKGSGSGSGQPLPRMMHVHRDPAMPPPYLNIHDPLHDSSGDQGNQLIYSNLMKLLIYSLIF